MTPLILIFAIWRPLLLGGLVLEARLAHSDSSISTLADSLSPNSDKQAEADNQAAAPEAHQPSIEAQLTTLLGPSAVQAIIINVIWAPCAAVHLITGECGFLLLQDDHRLTNEECGFHNRLSRNPHAGLPVLAGSCSSRLHIDVPTNDFRRTAFPKLWGLGANLTIIKRAKSLRTRALSPWKFGVSRAQGTALLNSKPSLSLIQLSKMLHVGVRFLNHFDALRQATTIRGWQSISTLSGPDFIDLDGEVHAYSPRRGRQEPKTCEANDYGPDIVCHQCKSWSQTMHSFHLLNTTRGRVAEIIRIPIQTPQERR